MEYLGDILAPHSDFIAKVAGTITTLQFLSGIALLRDIQKRNSADAYPVEPFLGGFVLTILGWRLGYAMNDQATIKTNLIGLAINVVFTAVFYYYASADFRKKIWTKMGVAAVFIVACLLYATLEDPEKLELRLGMLITGILVYLVGSPLLHIGKIFEKKSTEGMPFPIILSGTLVAASWAIYGLSIKNNVVVYQNLLLFVLSSIQLSMFAIFPSTPVEEKSDNKKQDSSPSKKVN